MGDPSEPGAEDALRRLIAGGRPGEPIEEQMLFGQIETELFGTDETSVTLSRYELRERLGSGAAGVVYRGFDPELVREVAIKLISARGDGSLTDTQAQSKLLQEAQALARVSHPNVIAVYDVGLYREQDLGRLHVEDQSSAPARTGVFVVMELVDGPTLAQWLRNPVPLPWRRVLDLFREAGRGLAAAHACGLVHRDFKPANVVVGADGRVRVLDFGLARPVSGATEVTTCASSTASSESRRIVEDVSSAAKPIETSAIAGTPAYMAPEAHRGDPVDARSDQFSFCAALYEGLFGRLPFSSTTLELLAEEKHSGRVRPRRPGSRVPPAVYRVLARGLSHDPERRFASMEALLRALDRAASPTRRLVLAASAAATVAIASAALFWIDTDSPAHARLTNARIELELRPSPIAQSDLASSYSAKLVHEDGQRALGFARDAVATADGNLVALLGLDDALRLHRSQEADLVAHDVLPGIATCDSGERVVYARNFGRYNAPFPEQRLFVHENWRSREPAGVIEDLDRVLALSPDCARALIVVRRGGLPVLVSVVIDSGTATVVANDLHPRRPAEPPPEFVPPPVDLHTINWPSPTKVSWVQGGHEYVVDLLDGRPLAASSPAVAPPTVAPPPGPHRYVLPLDAAPHTLAVTAYFDLGGGKDWACGTRTFPGHRGTDFAPIGGFSAMDGGIPVRAAAWGTVVYTHDGEFDRCENGNCYSGNGWGNHVILRHGDGKHTVYGHLRRFSVTVSTGDVVSCGQKIGEVGSSGTSNGPHLHLEVRNAAGHHAVDDPFTGPCGGPVTYWIEQHDYGELPGSVCPG